MRIAHRVLAASALALPLVIGGATIAAADASHVPTANYDHGAFVVGPDGSALHFIDVKFGPDGASYLEGALVIGPDGVAGAFTETGIHGG
ncbi:hypothetical protein ACFCX4_32815 [Kitasatospora sp. NPDC056327]|uniref:hypothetical protein n=1 Tax=Kitasatospora sp. NPDC056327 TaxID=3345785 RepID=UPI0035DBC9DB